MASVTLNTSTVSNIPNIWSQSPGASFKYGRFLGLANQGWGAYNSTNGLPAPLAKSGEAKSDTLLGFGIGAGYNANLRAGLNVNLEGTAGSGQLNLKDNIKFDLTSDKQNFYLKSSYGYQPSELKITGPSAFASVTGRGDIDGSAYVLATVPGTDWNKIFSKSFSNSSPLFSRSFSSKSPQSISLFGGAANLAYDGINLDTKSNTQLANGVRSNGLSSFLTGTLDIDKIVGTILGYPSGLSFDATASFGALSVSAALTLADIFLKYKASISQQISATVDSITGLLKLENGQSLNYKIGDSIVLPRATNDTNNDGILNFKGSFTKWGTISNKTDILTDTTAGLNALAGSVSAAFKVKVGPISLNKTISKSVGPLFSSSWNLASDSFNAYQKSWNTALGTLDKSFSLAG